MSLPAQSPVKPSEYLALERRSQEKHELVEGEVLALAGASLAHNRLVGNLYSHLRNGLGSGRCEVFGSDLKVHVPQTGLFAYPDLTVVCGPVESLDDHQDVVINPTLLVEVLSPSTEAFDRGAKFAHYRALPSLQGYLLVSQDRRLLEHYGRDGDFWVLRTLAPPIEPPEISPRPDSETTLDKALHGAHGDSESLELPEIGASLTLDAVYQRVD